MPGYMHPCRYCDELVAKDAKVCPFCGRANPTGPLRCPQCRSPVESNWSLCSNCGQQLQVACPSCGKKTPLENVCVHCKAALTVICPNKKCKHPQLPADVCIKCGKPLK